MGDTGHALALRESEELHRIILINMSDAVFITDDGDVFTYICPNVDVIFGYGYEEVREMNQISLLLGRDLVDRGQLAKDGEIRNIQHEITTKGGIRRSLLIHIKRVAIKGGTTLYVCRDITEHKRSEEALRRKDASLKLALEAASMGTWDWHVPTGEMNWSPETHRIFGDQPCTQKPSLAAFFELLHPSDRARVSSTMSDAMEQAASYETEFRILGYDKVERWVMGKGKAIRNGKPLRMLGVFVDFTERHRLEEELRELSGRLIHAHEQERIRISRELHDDVSQRLSLLSVDLGLLRQQLNDLPAKVHERINELSVQVQDLGAELHRVSHELHPASLEQLGLEASIRAFCNELSNTRRLAVQLRVSGVPHPLPEEVSLCIYRVTQEALQNVVRHSKVNTAAVTLTGTKDELHLTVADTGVGFDPSAARKKPSLGLLSMQERARLVNGQFMIHSNQAQGTRIELRAPLRGRA